MVRNITITNLAEVRAARLARPEAMRPTKVNDKWRRPKMSARKIAEMRKSYIRAGKKWEWDIPRKIVHKQVEFKGHKRELRARERKAEIERCMKRMPKLIADYRQRVRERRAEKTGLAAIMHSPKERDPAVFRRVDY